jgi:hypothetical protein
LAPFRHRTAPKGAVLRKKRVLIYFEVSAEVEISSALL